MRYTEQGVIIDFDSDVHLFHQFLGLTDRMILGSFPDFTSLQAFYMRSFEVSEAVACEMVFDDAAEAGEVLACKILGDREPG